MTVWIDLNILVDRTSLTFESDIVIIFSLIKIIIWTICSLNSSKIKHKKLAKNKCDQTHSLSVPNNLNKRKRYIKLLLRNETIKDLDLIKRRRDLDQNSRRKKKSKGIEIVSADLTPGIVQVMIHEKIEIEIEIVTGVINIMTERDQDLEIEIERSVNNLPQKKLCYQHKSQCLQFQENPAKGRDQNPL